jgi:SAM-dependent methyltransferase
MDPHAARARLAALEADETLDDTGNLRGRLSAQNFVTEVADYALWRPSSEGWLALMPRVEALRQRLNAANDLLFQQLREQIRTGQCSPAELRRQFDQHTDYTATQPGYVHAGPDRLDVLVDGVLEITAPSVELKPPLPDMLHYEPTPARVVLDLVDHAGWGPEDVFYDIGSGLGRVVILIHLLTGCRAKGVEINSALCDQARQAAQRLNLTGVEFIRADAREVDCGKGTIFFFFTPFKASVWRAVLDRLRLKSRSQTVKLGTFGPCTLEAAQEPWLMSLDANADHAYKLALFQSR